MTRCKHKPGKPAKFWVPIAPGLVPPALTMTVRRCTRCGDYVSLGPSKDESDAVKVEMRAAGIAARGKPILCADTGSDVDCEECGWNDQRIYYPPGVQRGWLAGYLARCIATHEEP